MNQRSEEEKIRQLFHELREEDHLRAPCFSSALEAALSKTDARRPGRLIRQAAFVTASVILIISFALLLRHYSSRQQVDPAPTDKSISRAPDRKIEPPALPETKFVGPQKIIRRKARPALFEQATMISRWQSPTDSLLRTPGEELLRLVPRITDSALNLKSIPDSEKN